MRLCNLSFDHGATYDFCRVTLVSSIRDGQVEDVDTGGLEDGGIEPLGGRDAGS